MVKEAESESLEEVFRQRRKRNRRPHSGPSGLEYEAYKQGGTDSRGASFNVEQEFEESQSLEQAHKPGLIGRIKEAVLGSSADYLDLGELTENYHGVIDPSDYNVPQVQGWIDEQLEDEPDLKMVERVLAAEEKGEERVGVLEYVDDSDLSEGFSTDELEFYDDKSEFAP